MQLVHKSLFGLTSNTFLYTLCSVALLNGRKNSNFLLDLDKCYKHVTSALWTLQHRGGQYGLKLKINLKSSHQDISYERAENFFFSKKDSKHSSDTGCILLKWTKLNGSEG